MWILGLEGLSKPVLLTRYVEGEQPSNQLKLLLEDSFTKVSYV